MKYKSIKRMQSHDHYHHISEIAILLNDGKSFTNRYDFIKKWNYIEPIFVSFVENENTNKFHKDILISFFSFMKNYERKEKIKKIQKNLAN